MNSTDIPRYEDLITVEQAAEAYGLGESTVWQLMKRYEIARYRVPGAGKRTHIRRDVFEQALRTPVPVDREPSKKAAA